MYAGFEVMNSYGPKIRIKIQNHPKSWESPVLNIYFLVSLLGTFAIIVVIGSQTWEWNEGTGCLWTSRRRC